MLRRLFYLAALLGCATIGLGVSVALAAPGDTTGPPTTTEPTTTTESEPPGCDQACVQAYEDRIDGLETHVAGLEGERDALIAQRDNLLTQLTAEQQDEQALADQHAAAQVQLDHLNEVLDSIEAAVAAR